jgi:hypothetical protein
MNRYALKAKNGETIRSVSSISEEEAIIYFAKIKNISKYALTKIFIIERVDT